MGFKGVDLESPDGTPFLLKVDDTGRAFCEDDQGGEVAGMGGSAGPQYSIHCSHWEENGPISAGSNGNEWSQGNGSTGWIGQPIPVAGKIFAFSLNAETATAGATCGITWVDRSTNRLETAPLDPAAVHVVPPLDTAAPSHVYTLPTMIDIPAGTVLAPRTTAVSGTITDVRVYAWLLLEIPQVPLS